MKHSHKRLTQLLNEIAIKEGTHPTLLNGVQASGIDKVVSAAEVFQLPAPDFRVGEIRTTAVLFAHQDFSAMTKSDRIRACYQHCVLQYVNANRMSNQSLRDRFGLPESKSATISLVLGETKDLGLIKLDESDTSSTRYARYLPFGGRLECFSANRFNGVVLS